MYYDDVFCIFENAMSRDRRIEFYVSIKGVMVVNGEGWGAVDGGSVHDLVEYFLFPYSVPSGSRRLRSVVTKDGGTLL